MSKFSSIFASAIVLGGMMFGSSAQAASSFVGTSVGDFGVVDADTGSFTKIGNTGFSLFDIAVLDDSLGYGVNSSGSLFEVDLSDASTKLIGNLGRFANGLAFDDSGNLFGIGGSDFFSVDITNANTSLLSSIDGFTSSGDLAYDGSQFFLTSSLGLTDSLFSINADGTGVAEIGNIGFADVFGLTYQDNRLLGYTDRNEILEINQTTGAGVQIAEVSGARGGVFGAAPIANSASVPEPGMAFALVGLGLGCCRKRKAA